MIFRYQCVWISVHFDLSSAISLGRSKCTDNNYYEHPLGMRGLQQTYCRAHANSSNCLIFNLEVTAFLSLYYCDTVGALHEWFIKKYVSQWVLLPSNHWTNAGLMLVHCLWRWPNVKTALSQYQRVSLGWLTARGGMTYSTGLVIYRPPDCQIWGNVTGILTSWTRYWPLGTRILMF